ncbi:MAG: FG-GAP repeat protein [Candidatus Thiodiazotropha sp. (ex Dulcina madagascariensis)]|nr:FG-GAP repeat protein [Candidatus Thiodiazotropha sp. (ex Dulcina madagascariensis)]
MFTEHSGKSSRRIGGILGIALLVSATPTWPQTPIQTEVAKLLASDGPTPNHYGYSVTIDGDTALIGSNGTNYFPSSVDVFTRSVSGAWVWQDTLVASDGIKWHFGQSVALYGDTAVIGAYGDDVNGNYSGSAYMFTRDNMGGWNQQAKHLTSDGSINDWLGMSVAVDGKTALIGAFQVDDNGHGSGAAYVFTRVRDGAWMEQVKLLASDVSQGDNFGFSVAIDGSIAVLGAPGKYVDGIRAGSAYVFSLCSSPIQSLEVVINEMQTIVDANLGNELADKIEDALTKAQTALSELMKSPADAEAATGVLEGAVGDIDAAIVDGLLDMEEGVELIDPVVVVVRQMAEYTVKEAVTSGADPSVITDAQEYLEEGDALRQAGEFKDAVSKYKDALSKSGSVVPPSITVEAYCG